MSVTIVRFIPAYGHTLDAGVRAILDANGNAVRTELQPQSSFAGDPEFDTNQDLLSSPSPWSVLNTGACSSLDSNSSFKGYLSFASSSNAGWEASGAACSVVYQDKTGNFKVYCRVSCGPELAASPKFIALGCIDPGAANNFVWVATVLGDSASAGAYVNSVYFRSAVSGSGSDTIAVPSMVTFGGVCYLKLERTGNDVSGDVSQDGKNWTSIATVTRSDLPSTLRLGVGFPNYNGESAVGRCDFLRDWPPYLTTSPTSYLVIDSGANGTTWDMSTFIALENEYKEYSPQSQIGFGTLKYQYGADNSNPPTLNGSWKTASQMTSESDPTGRYFKLAVQYNSANGYELASFNGAMIDSVVTTSGGGIIRPVAMNGGFV